jgi:DNA repair protein RecO (recombination protein O)
MRTFKTEGIIIKRKNYAEADRILTVMTRYHGKIQVKAAGIRKIPSRRSAHVELLNHSLLSLYKANHLPVLTEAQTIENFSPIKEDLQTIGNAYHLCELIDSLCPENQETPQVFDLLKDTLNKLSFSTSPLLKEGRGDFNSATQITGPHQFPVVQESASKPLIQNFEINLLTTLGYSSKADLVTQNFNTRAFIENIIERKLKTYPIFAKL